MLKTGALLLADIDPKQAGDTYNKALKAMFPTGGNVEGLDRTDKKLMEILKEEAGKAFRVGLPAGYTDKKRQRRRAGPSLEKGRKWKLEP
jgi:hypothetical protein